MECADWKSCDPPRERRYSLLLPMEGDSSCAPGRCSVLAELVEYADADADLTSLAAGPVPGVPVVDMKDPPDADDAELESGVDRTRANRDRRFPAAAASGAPDDDDADACVLAAAAAAGAENRAGEVGLAEDGVVVLLPILGGATRVSE